MGWKKLSDAVFWRYLLYIIFGDVWWFLNISGLHAHLVPLSAFFRGSVMFYTSSLELGKLEPCVINMWNISSLGADSSVQNGGCPGCWRCWKLPRHIQSWLVVSNMKFIFHYIWDNPSHWLSYFSRWLLHHQPESMFHVPLVFVLFVVFQYVSRVTVIETWNGSRPRQFRGSCARLGVTCKRTFMWMRSGGSLGQLRICLSCLCGAGGWCCWWWWSIDAV